MILMMKGWDGAIINPTIKLCSVEKQRKSSNLTFLYRESKEGFSQYKPKMLLMGTEQGFNKTHANNGNSLINSLLLRTEKITISCTWYRSDNRPALVINIYST